MLRALLVLSAVLSVAALAGAGWFFVALTPVAGGDAGGAEPVVFEVPAGASLASIATGLEREGLVRDARATRWLARARGLATELKTGEYELSPSQSTPEILDVLQQGRVRTHAVVIPEGLRAVEIADRLAEAGLVDREAFLAIVHDPEAVRTRGLEGETLEGYLFPNTYRFARGLPAERVIDTMVDGFLEIYRRLEPEIQTQGFSMHELVILASIVEKETGVAEERPLIAAVFLNRMARGMRLETDPTVIYGIEDFDGNLRRVHLEDPSNAYNTYRIRGLPPGPIANPGEAALKAVLAPADSDYLFFVSRNDGTHEFARTYAEHVRNVDRYQRRRRR